MVEKDTPKTWEKRMIGRGNTKRHVQSQKGISPSGREASGLVERQPESGTSFSPFLTKWEARLSLFLWNEKHDYQPSMREEDRELETGRDCTRFDIVLTVNKEQKSNFWVMFIRNACKREAGGAGWSDPIQVPLFDAALQVGWVWADCSAKGRQEWGF